MSSKLFINAGLVGHPPGRYSVLVRDGIVERISESSLQDEAAEIVDLGRSDGSASFIGPVGLAGFTRSTAETRD